MPPPSSPAPAPAKADTALPIAGVTLSKLEITLQSSDILRSLRDRPETAPDSDIIRSIEALTHEAAAWLRPRGTYAIYVPTALTDHSLEIGGWKIECDASRIFRGASRIAVYMATVGNEITRQADLKRTSGDPSTSRILDAIGSWAAERSAEALMANLAGHLGPEESFTVRYSPGFCGMDLSEQRVLFRLVPAENLGIALLPSLFMEPLKSVSGLVGLGPRETVGVHLSPCELCTLVNCHMRG